jgi:hypothetical protein
MTVALIVAAVTAALDVVAGEASARTYRRRLARVGRSRMPAAPEKVR